MRLNIPAAHLRTLFGIRQIKNLFHANAIETSLTFFSVDALISRAQAEARKLPQSPQYSDNIDKQFGIYDDIWLNFSDFHRNFGRPNEYGPATFRFPLMRLLDFLVNDPTIKVSITKQNVDKWKASDSPTDRWFADIADFESIFLHDRVHKDNTYFNRALPDLVISNLPTGLPLTLCDTVLIEKHPELTRLLKDVQNAITSQSAHYLLRHQPIAWRNFCKTTCSCGSLEPYLKPNISAKFKFGGWKKLINQETYENWTRGRTA